MRYGKDLDSAATEDGGDLRRRWMARIELRHGGEIVGDEPLASVDVVVEREHDDGPARDSAHLDQPCDRVGPVMDGEKRQGAIETPVLERKVVRNGTNGNGRGDRPLF